MSKIFFISDLHFGHENIIKYDHRPFNSVNEMDDTMISNWNSTVTEEDTVYILGDFSWRNAKETAEILEKLKGKKNLIIGNHDTKFVNDKKCRKEFIEICNYKEITVDKTKIVLSHYPIMFWKDQWTGVPHLYGHVHMTQDYDLLLKFIAETRKTGNPCNMYNVGCMTPWINYIPRTLSQILSGRKH